jgi:hypothetical protein
MDSVEDHARQEANHEKKNLESVMSLMQIRIKQLSESMMIKHLSHLHVFVPADKASNNVVCVCKSVN